MTREQFSEAFNPVPKVNDDGTFDALLTNNSKLVKVAPEGKSFKSFEDAVQYAYNSYIETNGNVLRSKC